MLGLPPQGDATRLLLVRHGETDVAYRGRCYGRLDVRLSAEGRRQAEALAAALAELPLVAVYASPLARALDTARPLAAGRGLEPVAVDGLREIDFGELEGVAYEDIRSGRADVFRRWAETPAEVRFPGGESFPDLRERVLRAVGGIRERHVGEAVAVVAHGGVGRVVLADALGLADGAIFRLEQSFGGVSVVDWVGGAPVVRVVNAVF